MKVHHAGKNGDLVYALPVVKALAREHGPVTLITSALCYQLVPLLWEQPYIKDVEMDYSRSYKIDGGSLVPWAVLEPHEGINLSPQPSMYRMTAPVPWTLAYAEIAGIKELTPQDKIALPTLWNHRQWFWEHIVKREDARDWAPPKTCILAPESETLRTIPSWLWRNIAEELRHAFRVIIIGTRIEPWALSDGIVDLRGITTVPTIARMLAEAHVAICANSLPWHLARHAGTPVWCFQDAHVERCVPVDAPSLWATSERWKEMVEQVMGLSSHPRTTLWPERELRQLQGELRGLGV